jgi:hypothetical protein
LFLTLGFFYVSFGLYLFIDNPLRNLIAVTIFLFSIKYLHTRQFFLFFLVFLLSFSFHFSALIVLIFYFTLNKNLSSTTWIILFIASSFFSVLLKESFISQILNLFGQNEFIGQKIGFYFDSRNHLDSSFFSLGSLLKVLFFVLILRSRNRMIDDHEYGYLIFNGAMLFFIINRFAASIEILSRFQLYLTPFYCVAVIKSISSFSLVSRKIYKLSLSMLIFLLLLREITTTYKYIPYTSYLFYLNEEIPFYERSMYNFRMNPDKIPSNEE